MYLKSAANLKLVEYSQFDNVVIASSNNDENFLFCLIEQFKYSSSGIILKNIDLKLSSDF